jgi:hypothetical protein
LTTPGDEVGDLTGFALMGTHGNVAGETNLGGRPSGVHWLNLIGAGIDAVGAASGTADIDQRGGRGAYVKPPMAPAATMQQHRSNDG